MDKKKDIAYLIEILSTTNIDPLRESWEDIKKGIVSINTLQKEVSKLYENKEINRRDFLKVDNEMYKKILIESIIEKDKALKFSIQEAYKGRLRLLISYYLGKNPEDEASLTFLGTIIRETTLLLEERLNIIRANGIINASFNKIGNNWCMEEIEDIKTFIERLKTLEINKINFNLSEHSREFLTTLNPEIIFEKICLEKELLK